MSKLNKLFTLFLFGLLVFVIVFLSSQRYYDKQKNYGMNNSEINLIEIKKDSNIDFIEINNENNHNLLENLNENQYKINDYIVYNIKDIIKLNIPSKTSTYKKENNIIELSKGTMNNIEFKIDFYEFNKDDYTLNFIIDIYSNNNENYIISTDNFKVIYADKNLINLKILDYQINSNSTKMELSFKFDDSINLKDINTTYFKFYYVDDLNIREIKLY